MSAKIFGKILLLVLTASLIFFGCSDDDETIIGDDTELNLDSALVELSDLMETMIDSVFESGNSAPVDFDYSSLHSFFRAYLHAHPGDPTASFGASITTLMTFMTSDELDSMVGVVMDYADSVSGPFKMIVPNPAKLSGKYDMLRFPTEISGAGVEKNFLAQSYFAVLSKTLADPMDISDAQDFIKTEFMPALEDAIDYMDNILAQPNYIFWVTPAMMGQTSSDSLEIDRPDFLVFAAGLKTIKSFCHLMVAYDIDVPAYDSTALDYLFNQANGWMSLHNDGATHMASAKSEFLAAADMVDDALTALEAEQISDPNQSNDLIIADWSGAEYDEAHDVIDSITTYMTSPQWIVGDFDDDPSDDSVRVDASAIFDNPIDGLFDLLPPYTAEISTAVDTSWYWTYEWNGSYWEEVWYPEEYSFPLITITWEANSFAEWEFPNPTINGILPDITTDAAFKDLVGLTADDWTKVMELPLDIDFDDIDPGDIDF
ncbi:MAG: hypothetical protein GY841_11070 [FCB group bacterium]|nr:hypothetical protein [FCB group bacterium]